MCAPTNQKSGSEDIIFLILWLRIFRQMFVSLSQQNLVRTIALQVATVGDVASWLL